MNQVRRRFGFGYWSLAAFMKHKVKTAVQYMSSFESAVAYEAARQRVDGLICGHIHRAEITHLNGVSVLQQRGLGGELHGARRAS